MYSNSFGVKGYIMNRDEKKIVYAVARRFIVCELVWI